MLTKSRIDFKGVVFDFDNTLVDTKKTILEAYTKVFSEMAEKFNVDKERLISEADAFQQEKIRELAESKASYNHADWIPLIAEKGSIKLNEKEKEYYKQVFYSYVIENQKFSSETEELLKELKKDGKKLALLSERDSISGLKAERINKVPFHKYFDVVVIAGETIPFSKAKDGAKPFIETARLLGLSTKDIIMVGDRRDLDIQNAKESGMKAVLFTGYNNSQEKCNYEPDLVISDISEFGRIL
ncbi:HAD hydrolase-like protein [Candidatus Parvarchaeota archaeon]|nr:HAD hydrolase-like protein [Candidatus Parvarchaeota archaeon]